MLSPTQGRVVVSVDLQFKNHHTFANGTVIRLERQWNNLNKRHTEPVNAIAVSGGGVPEGSEILIHHNATHPVCQVFNFKKLSGNDVADSVKYFSIPETQCYLWRKGTGAWMPMNGFETALRVFEPVKTQFYGIVPNLIKNTLYITSGKLKGFVVHTLRASDYEIIFRNEKGVEEKIIRCRHFNEGGNEREEIVAINYDLTEKVKSGECYVGFSPTDSKSINQQPCLQIDS